MFQLSSWPICRCRIAVLSASLLAIPASSAGMQASAQLPGPELCDEAPADLSGRYVVTAPSVVGLQSEQAQERLLSSGIDPQVVEVRSRAPRGMVVNQWPKPEQEIVGFVRLCVSNGEDPPAILMPDLAGRTLEQARRVLAARQIAGNPTVRRAENPGPAGTIYDQSPEAGTVVTADSAIVLNVSDGPPAPPGPPPAVDAPPVQPSAAAAPSPVQPGASDGVVASEPPPSVPQRDLPRIALPGLLLVIALLAAGLMTRSHLAQRRPRFRVRMAGMPMASVDWGDPPEPGFECRLVPPLGRCLLERDDGAGADD